MAGQPLKRACSAVLDQHEPEIFQRLASGEFVTDLAREYLADPYAEQGRGEPQTHYFYAWLDDAEGRRARFERVREAAADAVAEESIRILDEAREEGVSSTAEATLARSQSSARQWWASKLNRAKYGEGRQEVGVSFDIGELHLDALIQHGSMDRGQAVQGRGSERIIEGEYEEIEAPDAGPGRGVSYGPEPESGDA